MTRAIAIATERPYQEIWDALKAMMEAEGPRQRRSGVEELVQHKLMETLGWTWVSTSKVHLREDELPSGRLVVSIRQHSVAVVDGVIHDTHDCSLNEWKKPPHVYGYYKKGVSVHGTGRNMNNERKRLLDVVAKLLALADGGSTEAEAASAKAKAAALIAKYDITVASSKDWEKFEAVSEFRVGDVPSYEFTLLSAVGRFCGVLVMSVPRQNGGRNYEFFGKPQDLEAFRYMRGIVSAQQGLAWMDYLSARPDCARQRVSWKNSYANGVAEKVDELMRAATVQQKAMRQDLVLVPRREQAEAEYECLFGKLGSGGYGYGGEGNAHGYEAGKNVSLNKGVKSDGPVRQITKRD
jgi:Protein of unknown function (DUF2786)